MAGELPPPVHRRYPIQCMHSKNPDNLTYQGFKQRYKDSNLEMTESESVALPFGDSPSTINDYSGKRAVWQALFPTFFKNF